MSKAVPTPSTCFDPKNEKDVYEAIAPTGVDALNSIRCLLHSTREREVDIRETVYAREVGAAGAHKWPNKLSE